MMCGDVVTALRHTEGEDAQRCGRELPEGIRGGLDSTRSVRPGTFLLWSKLGLQISV